MEQAQQHMEAGRFAEAEAIYRSLLEHDAGNTEALYMLAMARRAQGDLDEAIGLVEQAADQEPDNVNVQYTLATLHMDRRSVDEARRAYLKALQIDPLHLDSHNGLAYVELVAGNFTAAERAANLALNEDSNNVQALVYLGTAKLEQGDATTAIAYLQEALKHAPGHRSAQLLLGRAFLAAGHHAFAVQCINNVLEKDPGSGTAWELLAQCEEALGNPENADQARLAYATLLAKSGRTKDADAIIDELLARDEPLLAARFYRGAQLCREGDDSGIAMLREIENEDGLPEQDRHRINRLLAAALDATGRFGEAAGYFRKIAGRKSRASEVARSGATANREFLETGIDSDAARREDETPLPGDPVFVFAWPGSGWEWLAAGLGAHPGVMLVADQAETQSARRALISQPAGPEALAALSGEAAGQAAARYWAHLESGGLKPGGRITVDTMWISADMLPTLARLFPSARILVLGRDPREMALEWFRGGYTGLAEMAETYAEQLAALHKYRSVLGLQFIDIDGGVLQAEPEPELRRLLETLGLEWEDPVAAQVQAIAAAAKRVRGTWSDYREYLEEPLGVFGDKLGHLFKQD
jgi:tetratricopeptide (TPR) repeat protein